MSKNQKSYVIHADCSVAPSQLPLSSKSWSEYFYSHPLICPTCGLKRDGHTHGTMAVITTIPASVLAESEPVATPELCPPVELRKPRAKSRKKFGKTKVAKPQSESDVTWLAENYEAASPAIDVNKQIEEDAYWHGIKRLCIASSRKHTFKKSRESRPVLEDRQGDAAGNALMALCEPKVRAKLESLEGEDKLKFVRTVAKRRTINTVLKASNRREINATRIKRGGSSEYDPSKSDLADASGNILDVLSSGEVKVSEYGNRWAVDQPSGSSWNSEQWDMDLATGNVYQKAPTLGQAISADALKQLFQEAIDSLEPEPKLCFMLYSNYEGWAIPGGRTYTQVADCLTSYFETKFSLSQTKRLFAKAEREIRAFIIPKLPHDLGNYFKRLEEKERKEAEDAEKLKERMNEIRKRQPSKKVIRGLLEKHLGPRPCDKCGCLSDGVITFYGGPLWNALWVPDVTLESVEAAIAKLVVRCKPCHRKYRRASA
jgi:hypothetical protein